MPFRRFSLYATLLSLLLNGCSGLPGSLFGSSEPQAAAPRTLTVATRAEPPSLSPKPLRPLGLTSDLSARMFNAGLTIRDNTGRPIPYLAEELPQFSADTWRVQGDGAMETVYRLKPRLSWHDRAPLTADDFVFAFKVYAEPAFGWSNLPPINLIDNVFAADERTVVIHWKGSFADADALNAGSGGTSTTALPPLPRHVLAQGYESGDPIAFMAHPYWTTSYVGAGPYRLDRWEPGAYLEGVAFDRDALGKPRINRIREIFMGDPNVLLASVLAGEVQLTVGDAIRYEQGLILDRQWGEDGTVINSPSNLYRIIQLQQRPEYASTLAFRDPRVRQALHYAIDLPPLKDAIFHGNALDATGPIKPTASYYRDLDSSVAHYPFDPLRSGQLMVSAGFALGRDAIWTSSQPGMGRLGFDLATLAAPDNENEMHALASGWRQLGFDVREVAWAPVLGADGQTRNTFPGLSTTSAVHGEMAFGGYRSSRVPSSQHQWFGTNRGGWQAPPDYDRLVDSFESSLDRNERSRIAIRMNQVLNQEAAVINLYWKPNAQAVARGVVGPRRTDANGDPHWNIHEWDYR